MTPVNSLITTHDPKNGLYGDCFRACVASLLDLPSEDVPHFCDGLQDANDAAHITDEASAFCERTAGLKFIEFPCAADTLQELLDANAFRFRGVHYMLLGRSATTNHNVIACGGRIVHDPTYGDSHGIVGPCDDGYFWVGLLVKP